MARRVQVFFAMVGYASRTGTKRNLDALRAHGWGLLVCATGVHRTEGFDTYAIDNGAFTAYQQGKPFDVGAFLELVALHGHGAQFIVLPDIVAGGLDSLELTRSWIPRLDGIGRRRLVAVQDGMVPHDVEALTGDDVGIFLGGSTEWKLSKMQMWGTFCRAHGLYFHVGRVNTMQRIKMCHLAHAHSFDGTSVTRFAKNIHRLDRAKRQRTIPGL